MNPDTLEKEFLMKYLSKLDAFPFQLTFADGETAMIGQGVPQFNVRILGTIPKAELLHSTFLA